MIILEETTVWNDPQIPNHVYVLNDSQTKLIAYVRAGTKTLQKFKVPYSFDRRGRTFKELGNTKPEPDVITVQGSKGQQYYVSDAGNGLVCTCPGFTFRGKCKHVNETV